MLRKLTLTHFRNYESLQLAFDPAPVAFIGVNGAGKTNILEAISLLTAGKGLRRADLAEFRQAGTPANTAWGVAAEWQAGDDFPTLLGTARDVGSDAERRLYAIDGKPATATAFGNLFTITWLTPDMDRLLAGPAADRRRFFDKLVSGFDAAHQGRLTRYEKAMRERMLLLTDNRRNADASWLNALEEEMAQSGIAIAAARLDFIERLNAAEDQLIAAFPRARFGFSGMAEEMLAAGTPALLVEDKLKEALHATRNTDGISGSTQHGTHKTDITALFIVKDIPAALCSTGEQKALLLGLLLSHAILVKNTHGQPPIMLLDEACSHLDEGRRQAMFKAIQALEIQAFFTGTDEGLFMDNLSPQNIFQVIDNKGKIASVRSLKTC